MSTVLQLSGSTADGMPTSTTCQIVYLSSANDRYSGSASWLRVVSTKLYGKEEWSAIRLFQVADHVQNHLACTIIDAREATTESLSRSELYTTLHLMYQGLHRSKSAVNIPVSYVNTVLER